MSTLLSATKSKSRARGASRTLISFGSFVSLVSVIISLVLWEIITRWVAPSIFIPPFSKVAIRAFEMTRTGEIFDHITISLYRIVIGFGIGCLLGAPLGLLMGTSKSCREAFDPHIQFFRFIPSIAWLTPAVIWFGIGETSKFFIIAYVTMFIVAINTMVGVLTIPQNKILAAITLGCSKSQLFYFVTLPAAAPFILTGMRLAMGNSFAAVVSAEMVSAHEGIGYLIFDSRLWMATDTIFVGILALGFLGFGTDVLFRFLIRRYAKRFGTVD